MDTKQSTTEKIFDLVCGMELNSSEIKHETEYHGKTYHFCSENCKDQFEKSPEKYTSKEHEHAGCCH